MSDEESDVSSEKEEKTQEEEKDPRKKELEFLHFD